ncbi:TBC1 domain family member 15-like [Latimeria chalumnae]|uniref:TBC1 domain family member 15-like n=1 Tax=Latimeria chalumnae TaxID=7897 RepID=UPI00313ADBC3
MEPELRRYGWKFLFQLYPVNATTAERASIDLHLSARYAAMKSQWLNVLPNAAKLTASVSEEQFVAVAERYQEQHTPVRQEGTMEDKILPFFQEKMKQFSRTVQVDRESLEKNILAIDPDIPRTHRELAFYQNEGLVGLMVVRDILITYCAQYPAHGYAQGTADVASCFYEALGSEAEAFFCFSNYMRRYGADYMPEGLTKKIESMALILRKLDPTLHSHLAQEDLLSFNFCHRWLLLNFQREFSYGEGQRLMEMLASSCLGASGMEPEEFAQPGLPRLLLRWVQTKLRKPIDTRLELFICAAILIKHREMLLRCHDPAELIDFVRRMQGNIDLMGIVMEAKQLYYRCCSDAHTTSETSSP